MSVVYALDVTYDVFKTKSKSLQLPTSAASTAWYVTSIINSICRCIAFAMSCLGSAVSWKCPRDDLLAISHACEIACIKASIFRLMDHCSTDSLPLPMSKQLGPLHDHIIQ